MTVPAAPRPSKVELEAALDRVVPDVLEPGLAVVFVGINPGLWSAAVGHHFARPGNRFWRALERSGFTDRLLDASEDRSLPRYGIGVTNLVERATATADQLDRDELRAGARALERKLSGVRPRAVAFLGIGAYRFAFERRRAGFGRQQIGIAGLDTWLLPNPSGLNAHHQVDDLAERFAELRRSLA